MTQQGEAGRRGRWIPWLFVGGMAVVVAANLVMVHFALSTFTGVAVPRAYERGRGYAEVLAEAARQDALGWRASLSLTAERLSVLIVDREGAPLIGRLEGVLVRPIEGTTLPLHFATRGAGRFVADLALPKRGQWEARLTFFGPQGTAFDIRERLIVP